MHFEPSIRCRTTSDERRGAVAVEFAVVAPLFLVVVFGMVQATQMIDERNLLAMAAREGARLAAMDREGLVAPGASTNAKVTADIEKFLKMSGVSPDALTIEIVDHEDPTKTFDLDDPNNDYRLFEIRLKLPYAKHLSGVKQFNLSSKVVFRNSRSTIVE